eukprot:3488219-Amphidinium_carterae.1
MVTLSVQPTRSKEVNARHGPSLHHHPLRPIVLHGTNKSVLVTMHFQQALHGTSRLKLRTANQCPGRMISDQCIAHSPPKCNQNGT